MPATVEARRAQGRALRTKTPRSSHATWEPPAKRRDPIAILEEQESSRVAELLPIRHARMVASSFSFLRGAAAIMAEDLGHTPTSGLRVQACGDAHLLNFGIFATPERNLTFDVNDFDETLPAPFEWDVKRLAASVVVAGRDRGFAERDCRAAAKQAAAAYRTAMNGYAQMGYLDIWYARIDVSEILAEMQTSEARRLEKNVVRKARRSTSLGALGKLTESSNGVPHIIDNPPLVEHVRTPGPIGTRLALDRYRRSLPDDLRTLLERYTMVDFARKVVGVGSVGTDDAMALVLGTGPGDPLFLQVKEAQRSVLEPFAGASAYSNHGQRVVWGQRTMQAASDIFLGWTRSRGRDYYVRQLRDMKGSIPVEKLTAKELLDYARGCGTVLARSHARSGDPAEIAGYLGTSDVFDAAIASFAAAYADQSAADFEELKKAVASGRVAASADG